MKSGIIGFVHGDFDRIESQTTSVEKGETELQRCIDVENTLTLESGREVQVGSVAKEDRVKEERARIENGTVASEERINIETSYTRFVAIPGEVVILGTGGGTFGFDLIGRQVEALIERAEIDLNEFVSHHEDADYWQYGFYNTGLNAENGVFYGTEVEEDSNAQTFINSSVPNQVGLDFLYGDKPVKAKLAESGYVEVYQPGEWETTEYVGFVADAVLPYVRSP